MKLLNLTYIFKVNDLRKKLLNYKMLKVDREQQAGGGRTMQDLRALAPTHPLLATRSLGLGQGAGRGSCRTPSSSL